jgi:hypothetical protein
MLRAEINSDCSRLHARRFKEMLLCDKIRLLIKRIAAFRNLKTKNMPTPPLLLLLLAATTKQ